MDRAPLDPQLRETLKSYLRRIFLFENGSRTTFIIVRIIRKLACFVPEKKITRINLLCLPFAKFLPHVRHVRESKTGLDSGFHTVDSRSQVLDSLSVELGFGIPIVSGSSDSLSCISDSKAKGSGFFKQKFLGIGLRIPQAKIFPDSSILYYPLHGVEFHSLSGAFLRYSLSCSNKVIVVPMYLRARLN